MTLLLQNPLSNPTNRIKLHFPNTTTHLNSATRPKLSLSSPNPSTPPASQILNNNTLYYFSTSRLNLHTKAYNSSTLSIPELERPNNIFNIDAFLSVLESLCVVSSVVVSLGCIVNWVFLKQQNPGLVVLGNRVLVWLLAGAVAVGSVIRRRQWRRVCGAERSGSRLGSENGNLIERLEKLEDSMRSATTIIRMLSRQLEKLGIRFRVTRKALKDPITETAALAQKNSEATRALAVQEGILEKELAEVQKVLLAMQDQQQKQLDLILAIAKSGKLFETNQAPSQGLSLHETGSAESGKAAEAKLPTRQLDGQQMEVVVGQKGAVNDNSLGS